MSETVNIALRFSKIAKLHPDQIAAIETVQSRRNKPVKYRKMTFQELDQESDRIAAGLRAQGVGPGVRLVLFVPFSIDFISLTFAIFKTGATIVLIDPGMGRTNIFRCLEEVNPDGFVAIPIVHLVRLFKKRQFPNARLNVSAGCWMPGVIGKLSQLKKHDVSKFDITQTAADDLAAIIFTSGSTGPPKGVSYEHGMFDAQVEMIQSYYGIKQGEVDLPGFPLFGLFNAAMGVTTVIPEMDPTKPAEVDPLKIIRDVEEFQVTQAFGSPAFWNRVGRYCVENNIEFPSLNRALSAGGPVPVHVLKRMQTVITQPEADLFTPYGATESLPVASIGGSQVLNETAALTGQGAGTCVGKIFPNVDVKIIEITEGPVASIHDVTEKKAGEIGEIIVRSPSVTKEYFKRPEATALAKIPDGDSFWHRIGDVGYFDDDGKLWFCGRKAHIVVVDGQPHFSVKCEAIFNEHPKIYRSALVGFGDKPNQQPVIVAEPEAGEFPESKAEQDELLSELLQIAKRSEITQSIETILFHRSLPVDTRHNVKINREALAIWAMGELTR